jgi:hypothetical protein
MGGVWCLRARVADSTSGAQSCLPLPLPLPPRHTHTRLPPPLVYVETPGVAPLTKKNGESTSVLPRVEGGVPSCQVVQPRRQLLAAGAHVRLDALLLDGLCTPPNTHAHAHAHATPSRASGASTADGLPGTADLQDGVGHRADQRVAACMPDWVAVCAVTQARRSNRPCSNQSASAETVDRVRAGTNKKGGAVRAVL